MKHSFQKLVAVIFAFVMSSAEAATFVYVSNAADGTISSYKLNPFDGAMEVLATTPAGKSVMPLAVSPDKRYLYASIRSQPFSVASYSIDAKSGALTQLSTTGLPDSMAYISTDRTGRYLFGASYGGDVISVNPIGLNGQAIGTVTQVVKTGRMAHAILPSPSNRFVYASNLGSGQLLQFTFDESNGLLKANTPAFALPMGNPGTRHFVFSPNGKFVYASNELLGTVSTYAFDNATGLLSLVESVPGVPASLGLKDGVIFPPGSPADSTPRIWAADLHITPNGKFVYMSERISSTISAFGVDATTGKLIFLGSTPVEKQPRGFNIDSDGKYVVVTGEKSPEIGVYAIGQTDGTLTLLKRYPAGQGANWVEIVEFK